MPTEKHWCVDPKAKENWNAPFRPIPSSFKGDKLMTTNYVSSNYHKNKKDDSGKTQVRWSFGLEVYEAAKDSTRLGIPPPRVPEYIRAYHEKEDRELDRVYGRLKDEDKNS